MRAGCSSRDLLHRRRTVAVAFVLPALALVTIGSLRVDSRMQPGVCAQGGALWAPAALYVGFAPVRRGPVAWNTLAPVLVVGVVALTWLPERLFGRYRRRESLR